MRTLVYGSFFVVTELGLVIGDYVLHAGNIGIVASGLLFPFVWYQILSKWAKS